MKLSKQKGILRKKHLFSLIIIWMDIKGIDANMKKKSQEAQ